MLSVKDSASPIYLDQLQEKTSYLLNEMEWHLYQVRVHLQEACDHIKKFNEHQDELKEMVYAP